MIKVLMVDKHRAVVDAFMYAINAQANMEIIGGVTNSAQALDLCNKFAVDIIIIDMSVKEDVSAYKLTSIIKEKYSNTKVILTSAGNDILSVPTAKEIGASAFIFMDSPIIDFINAIKAVHEGQLIFPSEIQIPTVNGKSAYTQRELEVMIYLCDSLSRQQIADKMNIALGTVKRHVENILGKSGCKSVVELVAYIIGNGWILPTNLNNK